MLSMDYEILSYSIDSNPLLVGRVTITGSNFLIIEKQKLQLLKDICKLKPQLDEKDIQIRGIGNY